MVPMNAIPTGPTPIDPAPAGPAPAGPIPIDPALPGTASADAVPVNTDDPAYWRAKATAARAKARTLPWESDPELRAQVDMIMSMEPIDRLRQIEEEATFFMSLERVRDPHQG